MSNFDEPAVEPAGDAGKASEASPTTGEAQTSRISGRKWLSMLSFGNISVIYVGVALIIIFSIAAPSTFPTWTTVKGVLNGSAVPGLMALGVVLPLSARLFDLSIGNAMGLANMLVTWLLVNHGWGVAPAIILTLFAGLAMGVFNGLIIVNARIDSFIGTLATGSLFATVGSILSTQTISGTEMNGSFGQVSTIGIGGITLPVFLMLAVVIVLWFIQRYTVTGRRIYALGFNPRGSELVGIRTKRLSFLTLVVAGIIMGIAGVLLASSVNSGSPGIGDPYLLNAYAAAFLGATQFGGRFNAWGTALSVIMLEIGTTGLFLVGGATWTQNMFSGVVLLVALGGSNLEQAIRMRTWIRARGNRQVAQSATEG